MANNDQIQITPTDRDLAIRTMIGEEGNPQGQSGVASVILNRAQSGQYGGSSPAKVVLAPGEFEPWSTNSKSLMAISTDDPRYQKAAAIFDGVASGQVPDLTGGATHFFAPKAQAALGRAPPAWAQGKGTNIGDTVFYAPKGPVNYKPQMVDSAAPKQTAQAADPFSEYETTPAKASAAATQPTAAAPAAASPASPSAPADPFTEFETAPQSAAPAAAVRAVPKDAVLGQNGLMWNKDGGYDAKSGELVVAGKPLTDTSAGAMGEARSIASGFSEGMPIVGPYLNALQKSGAAQIRTLFGGNSDGNALTDIQNRDAADIAAHPTANEVGQVGGAIAATAPAMAVAPELFGVSKAPLAVNMLTGGATGATINAADAAVRSGGDWNAIKSGGIVGGTLGLLGPVGGEIASRGINALSNLVSRATPAARNIAEILANAGLTPEQAQQRLAKMGPHATLADIDPSIATEAGGVAALGGEPTAIMKNAYAARAAGSDDRMAQIVNETLGPKPNAQKMVADIRAREGANAVDSNAARAALNDTMGTPKDPHAVLQNMMAARSKAAQPLYQKALDRPVAWDNRLQDFLDDPIVQSGLAKGATIQRLESLADGTPYNPNDYVFKGKGVSNDPNTGRFVSTNIMGDTPNMRSLNVVKKGLDAMVEDAKDPVTGRLSEEGRAIDGVRKSFLAKLDEINPDYKAARQAWAGPTQTQEAFNKGLNIFQNRTGPSGLNSTPGALESWLKTASDGEKEAAKLGARSAFEQQMASASDPAAKAAAQASKEVNQQKLAAILGPDEAKNLSARLNFKYEDPVGQAFEKGMGLFKQREGLEGIEDTPDALKAWMKTASPAELEAHRQGARQAIEQSITSAAQGDVSKARSLFAKNSANRQKLDAIFPGARKMFDGLDNELRMRATEQSVMQNSLTAERSAVRQKYRPTQPSGSPNVLPALAGNALEGVPGAAAMTAAQHVWNQARSALTSAAQDRLESGTAHRLAAMGQMQYQFMKEIARAARINGPTNAIADTLNAGANLTVRSPADYARNALWTGQLLQQGGPQ